MTGRRRAFLSGGTGLAIVALAAGLLPLTSSCSDSDGAEAARRNLRPFREAVDALADAPGLRYKDTPAYGITVNEITVTAAGSQFGSTYSGHLAKQARSERYAVTCAKRHSVSRPPATAPAAACTTTM